MSSTSEDRRRLLLVLAAVPLAAIGSRAEAVDYASAGAVFDSVDRLAADVEARLAAIVHKLPSAGAFARSLGADFARHRSSRSVLRQRLGLGAAAGLPAQAVDGSPEGTVVKERGGAPPRGANDASLEGLHAALEALTFAHAEGLPVLGSAEAVDAMARDMVDCSRLLTVVSLWIDLEADRG